MLCPTPLPLVAFILIMYFYCTHQAVVKRETPAVDWASIVTSRGDRFPDFSYCGYRSSEIPLPGNSNPKITVSIPSNSSDDISPAIQAAIDAVAESGGGVVKLPSGKFFITGGIELRSNVVVAGSGDSETALAVQGSPSKPIFTLGSRGNATKPQYGFRSNITNEYVPIGTSTVTVLDSTGFIVNQSVYVSRAVTEPWIRYNGMSDLVRDGVLQTWIPEGKKIMSPNVIKAIDGTQISLEIPLTDALDSTYMSSELWVYSPPALYSDIGLENLRIEVPNTCSGVPLDDVVCNAAAVSFLSWTVDSWARGLTLEGFNSFFNVQQDASRITLQDIRMNRNLDINGSALPIDILIKGSQILTQDCEQVGLPTARCFTVATKPLHGTA